MLRGPRRRRAPGRVRGGLGRGDGPPHPGGGRGRGVSAAPGPGSVLSVAGPPGAARRRPDPGVAVGRAAAPAGRQAAGRDRGAVRGPGARRRRRRCPHALEGGAPLALARDPAAGAAGDSDDEPPPRPGAGAGPARGGGGGSLDGSVGLRPRPVCGRELPKAPVGAFMSDPPAYGQSFGPGFLRKVLALCVRTGLHRRVPGACDPDHFAEGSEGRLMGPRQRLAHLVERHGEADPRGWPGLESMDHLVEAEVRRLRTDEAAALREEWGTVREAEVPDAAYVEGEVL